MCMHYTCQQESLVHAPACLAIRHVHATYSNALENSANHNHGNVL